jgi:large subunit ribosomal protein L49
MPPPSFLTPTPTPLESNLDAPPSAVPSSQPASSSLPYAISRTSSGLSSLPIYESTKAGGSLHITTIRKCSGDLSLLQSHLLDALHLEASFLDRKGKKKENVKINPLTKQIIVRGWRGAEVRRWFEMVGF